MSKIMNFNRIAKEVFELESKAILNLEFLLTDDFGCAVEAILNSKGKCIVSGMGKSGIVGRKISATLSSTGTPSFFMHPAEAYHGDLGMIEYNDVVLLISNSGETDEILRLIPFLKAQNIKIISMTGSADSTLASNSHFHLNIYVEQEACPLQLAPTSSTTVTMVMGDAIAVALMRARGFKEVNFAEFHPGGSIGRKLLVTVESIMQSKNLATVTKDSTFDDVVSAITQGECGLCTVLDRNIICGVITDGDLRRCINHDDGSPLKILAQDMMTTEPKIISKECKMKDAEQIMLDNGITSLLVGENGRLLGVVRLYNL